MDFGIGTFVTDEGIRPDVLAKAVEERGFTALSLAEHSHIPASRETPYPSGGELPRVYYRTLDPFLALSAAAVATKTLRLGTGITLLIQRDLIHTAKEVATLDLLSGGRFDFGVGVGWNKEEMRNHGTDPATRGALMNEQLAALKEIWTKDEAEFHGKHIDFDPIFSWPKPVAKPHPPIFVGGASKAALNRLVAHGDGWLPTPGASPEELHRVRKWLGEQGRTDVPFVVWGSPADQAVIDGYAEGGVDQVNLMLPTLPESETLRKLDELAAFARANR
ncbi:LLM class F420-dependent oxidoreductase [Amycolatopsis sp. NPDC059021]|uniref:LLM class F420-dependent oxidoreductase n=1 Tax=Amycolatopsis sp. NPDC059021 TaxID=3346704 RepID=UPI00366FAFBA